MSLPILSTETAPAESRPTLEGAQRSMGFVPNLFGVLASSPAALEAYTSLAALQDKKSDFDATESQVLFISISAHNSCDYCVAAHSTISKGQKLPDPVITALRDGTVLPTSKLEALRTFALAVVDKRGFVSPEDLAAFRSAGYGDRHVLEVIVAVAFKTISNFTNHIAETALDDAFKPQAWSRPAAV